MCIDCKHYSSSLDDNLKSVRVCKKGNQKVMEQWWNENGEKVRGIWSILPCFEPHEISEILDSIVEETENALKEVNDLIDSIKKANNNE